jgi:NADPH:quinone reductase
MMGATVIAGASTAKKLNLCAEKGASHLINYQTENIKDRIKEITLGKGVDVVLDVVGDKYAEPALRSMAWNGRYLVVGFAAGDIPKLPFNLPLLKGCAIMGVFWGRFSTEEPKLNQQNIMELVNMILSRKISQHIHKTYSLGDAPTALQDMLDRKVMGKAMVEVREERLEARNERREAGDEKQEARGKKQETRDESREARSEKRDTRDKNQEESDGGVERKVFRSLEELKAHEGKPLGQSQWVEVSQEMIQNFAETTGDRQWIHVDTEKAKALIPGGKNLAHGYLTLSLIPQLMYEVLPLEGVQMALNYGTEKVRFPAPVFSGDKIHLDATLAKIEEKPDGSAKVFSKIEMHSDHADKPVCVAEVISMVRF